MSKTKLVYAMVRDGNGTISKAAASRAVDTFARTAREELAANGRFAIPGLGNLAVKQAAARDSRNPRTGAKVSIPARKKVKFSESSELKAFAAQCKAAA